LPDATPTQPSYPRDRVIDDLNRRLDELLEKEKSRK